MYECIFSYDVICLIDTTKSMALLFLRIFGWREEEVDFRRRVTLDCILSE